MADLPKNELGDIGPVPVIACNTARQFLTELQPVQPTWRGAPADRWVFRGHADSERWRLVASVFRNGKYVTRLGQTIQTPSSQPFEQIRNEILILSDFLGVADDIGLVTPGDWGRLRAPWAYEPWLDEPGLRRWPPGDFLESLAIAAHHRLPTRLLDFSADPLVAAFFASEEITRAGDSEPEELCVWGVDTRFLGQAWNPWEPEKHARIVLVTAPHATHHFLGKQRGAFIMDRDALWNYERSGQMESLDEVISQRVAEVADDPAFGDFLPPLVKVTAPRSIRAEVRDLLRRYHITEESLMPTLDRAAGVTLRSED